MSTAAFRDTAMSVDRVGIVQRLGHDVAFTQQSGAGVAEFTAAFARVLNQQVEATPIADNPAHAEVLGAKPKQVQRQFVEQMVFRST